MHQININHSYIDELQEKFSGINFKRLEKTDGMYITNPNNKSTSNDAKIFKETQIKRILRGALSPLVPQAIKNKKKIKMKIKFINLTILKVYNQMKDMLFKI
ncbi:MAG: hypothetical protein sGL2_11340 [Candidatus Mesenet longicola]|nr:MAG: hypothetical protein sGL2_11340 [Candidatus Mesenet longicola]